MTVEQLELIAVPPAVKPLTDRQQYALDHVERAGTDGLHTDEVGALLCERNGKHAAGDRCQWCGKAGLEVMNALKARELVRYRSKLKVWQTANAPQNMSGDIPEPFRKDGAWTAGERVPYGVIPF